MLIVVSSQIDRLFPEGHRAGRLSMDRCIFEAWKRTACIHGWLSIPCRTRSFVLGTGAREFCSLTPAQEASLLCSCCSPLLLVFDCVEALILYKYVLLLYPLGFHPCFLLLKYLLTFMILYLEQVE